MDPSTIDYSNCEDFNSSMPQKNCIKDENALKTRRSSSASVIPSTTWRQRSWLRFLGVEPVMICHGIANGGMQIIVQNFYIDRICRVSDNFTEGTCVNLTGNALDEKLVETGASEYTMFQSLLEYGIPILLALFIGPWMDKNGVKPVILLSLFGYLLSSMMYICIYYSPELPPGYILLCSVPLAISGGIVTFIISTYAFMMKQTCDESRSLRLVILSITWDSGGLIGCLAAAKIYELGGFLSVFIFGAVFYAIAFLYTLIVIEDEIPEQFDLNGYPSRCFSDFFDVTILWEMLCTCFKRRQGQVRSWILIITTCLSLQLLAYSSKINYQYLFTRNEFQWDTNAYSEYTAANTLLGSIGGTLMVFLFIKMLKMRDTFIVLINCISNISAYCLFALATAGWQMYLGSGIQMFGTISTAIMRSMLSKLVPKDENGKLLSFVTSVELAMPFLAGSMYGLVYMKTVLVFPGSIFFVAMGLSTIILFSFIYLCISMRNPVNYAILSEE